MKTCTRCEQFKDEDNFYYMNSTGKLHSWCKECLKTYNSEWFRTYNIEMDGVYKVWIAMKERCSNKNCKNWKHYGGKGVKVCREWQSFDDFHAWAKDKHEKGLELDRIDKNGNYCPENCRFISHADNIRNSGVAKLNWDKVREVRKLYSNGNTTQKELGDIYGVEQATISDIVNYNIWDNDPLRNKVGKSNDC